MYKVAELKTKTEKQRAPVPTGYKLLIALPKLEDSTQGGVILPDELKDREGIAAIIGFVMDVGPDAYKDTNKFPNGAWCKKGDFIIFRSYSGTRFKVDGEEFRLINDDTVEAVVDDPRGYQRA